MGSIDHEYLTSVLNYDPETGVFTWKASTTNRVQAGNIAGWQDKGYTRIEISGRTYRTHRLAWFYVHGNWPENEIDVINGIGTDVRLVNLLSTTVKKWVFRNMGGRKTMKLSI